MRRITIVAVLGIGVLFGGSLVLLEALDRPDSTHPAPPAPTPEVAAPRPEVSPSSPPAPKVIEPPPPSMAALPVPVVPELPPAPPKPSYDISDTNAALKRLVVERCGGLEVRFAEELRKSQEPLTGQAVLLLDVEPQQDQLYVWSASTQVAGATRPSLVACAQWAVKAKAVDARGVRPGPRFKVQLVVGMRQP